MELPFIRTYNNRKKKVNCSLMKKPANMQFLLPKEQFQGYVAV
jgi:hypothetical protein